MSVRRRRSCAAQLEDGVKTAVMVAQGLGKSPRQEASAVEAALNALRKLAAATHDPGIARYVHMVYGCAPDL